jgi:preprotein translocase subunit YajC
MSEKKIIILSLLAIFVLATTLMYLMINRDLNKSNKVIINNNQQTEAVITPPQIQIETSK